MSIELVSRVLRKSGYGGAEQQVLVILCDYADDQGYCYPSMLRIAWETGLTERAVRNIMRRLEASGTVQTTEHRGARNSNEYRITLENGPQKEPWETYRDRNKRPTKSERGSVRNQNDVPYKPEVRSEINRNDVPPKSEPDDRKSEPDDRKSERGSGEPSVDPSIEPLEPKGERRAKKAATKLTSTPDEFQPDESLYKWAYESHGFQPFEVDRETEACLDWHRANGSRKADWVATWRTWIRKAATFRDERSQRSSNGRGYGPKPTPLEQTMSAIDEVFSVIYEAEGKQTA